jgi:hypothetical protein
VTTKSVSPDLIPSVLSNVVGLGDFIPAHDETFDLAEEIAQKLQAFLAYVTEARDAEQAEGALAELGQAIAIATNARPTTITDFIAAKVKEI